MPIAVIMAGGRSERFRSTPGKCHKALEKVLGVPMIERNLCRLLSEGFHEIVVAISANEVEIENFVCTRGTLLASAKGATIECFIEEEPLGTIGATGEFEGRADAILVVNVDNLTTINLKGMLAHHLQSNAALTIASHIEPFQIPFGEVCIAGGNITRYIEKPIRGIPISSGTYVVGQQAWEYLSRHQHTDITDMFERLTENGLPISAFDHNSSWIDVNLVETVGKAERLICEKFQSFELWEQEPDLESAVLVIHSKAGLLVKLRDEFSLRYPGLWDIPGEILRDYRETPDAAISSQIHNNSAWHGLKHQYLTTFDDLDVATGKLIRHHVFHAQADEPANLLNNCTHEKWVSADEINYTPYLSPPFIRAAAFFGHLFDKNC